MARVRDAWVLVAGNTVLDVLVHRAELECGPAQDRWGSNVQLLDTPLTPVLGGCGAATSYVVGRLGHPVRLVTNIGVDPWAVLVREWLRQAGVKVMRSGTRDTAVNVILLSPDGRRRSVYYAGSKVDWEAQWPGPAPSWLAAAGYAAVDEGDLACLERAFATARRRGARVFFDPGPWFRGRVHAEGMRALWAGVDCLSGTQEELGYWLGGEEGEELARAALACGPSCAVVKRGARGAAYAAAEGYGCVLAEPLERGNSTGAGDAFNGRLLWGLAWGEALAAAVAAAVELATGVVRRGRGVLGAFG
ncbi:MAG: carbohydrate kinase family protein [Candidatus Latescibacterota bacterium]